MTTHTLPRRWFIVLLALAASGCAMLPMGESPKVSFAGMQSLPSEGMEIRFLVKLRVQNPSQTALEIDGVTLDLIVQGMGFASGVSPVKAKVARFGETLVEVPVTVPGTAMLRQAWGFVGAREVRKIAFELNGRLAAGHFGGHRFSSQGELDWPPGGAAAASTPRP